MERDLVARLRQALEYVGHPEVMAIPFVKPASLMAEQIRETLAEAELSNEKREGLLDHFCKQDERGRLQLIYLAILATRAEA